MKENIIIVRDNPDWDFEHGSCAHIAIASAFDMNPKSIGIILDILKVRNHSDGLTFFQCKKLINVICKSLQQSAEYTPGKGITLREYILLNQRGIHLIMFDEHLSYLKDGIIYDNYFDKDDLDELGASKPTGFWRIGNKPAIPLDTVQSKYIWCDFIYRYA